MAETPSSRGISPDVAALLARARPAGAGQAVLAEADAKALLRLYGIATPAEAVARSADEAVAAAARIGFPVVLKILSHTVLHKSDIGGVILGLADAPAVRDAYRRLEALLPERAPGTRLEAVLVAQQIDGGLELVLGVQRDPEVGPVVMFGTGGTLLELYRDVAFGPVPLRPEQAQAMIAATRAGRVLRGFRDLAPRDEAAVVAALVALGRLAHDLRDRIVSIDVNPFVALAEGGFALDALVVLRAGT